MNKLVVFVKGALPLAAFTIGCIYALKKYQPQLAARLSL